jgi:hypothetical protein
MDSRKLARRVVGPNTLPKGPILVIPINALPVGLSGGVGLTAINGCDMFFFDVRADGKYFCNVASAGDPKVVAAMRYWSAAGVMPVWLETPEGQCGLIRHDFQLNDIHEKAFADSDRKGYLLDLQKGFNNLLEPGVIETVVASRTGQVFDEVQVGFLATVHTQPALEPLH